MKILITGSLGLVGSIASQYFLKKGHQVIGIDNDMRKVFFGPEGSTAFQKKVLKKLKNYKHYKYDIRDKNKIDSVFKSNKIQAVIHTAAQPSHDKAKKIPIIDFEVNALGTLNLLEATRKYAKNTVFIYTSTNKVYGDNPNKVKLIETKTRYDFLNKSFRGFNETTSLDKCIHSLMGSSKLAGDIYVQEYGKYFGLNTTSIRLGCITGSAHAGVELHGFLSYLVKSLIRENKYKIIGYKGKQVRDQIHALDLACAFEEIIKKPTQGEVFNLGGGRKNGASVLELIRIISKKLHIDPKISYKKQARIGDHICYITDYSKFKKHYPKWKITKSIKSIINELIECELKLIRTNKE